MIIDLSNIESGPRFFDFTLNPGWWHGDETNRILGFDGPLECHAEISRVGIKYPLEGSISGYVLVTCDRCLEPCRRQLDFEFRLFLSAPVSDIDQNELELSEDDMSVQFIDSNKIDLDDIVREQIYISLPMKSLCREDCAGLCPVCGTDLNKKMCECRRGEGHPGFSKLKALLLNGEQ